MPDPSVDQTAIINAIISTAGRSTLPIRQAPSDRNPGTAFWFDDPVGAGDDPDEVRQYLVTADALTRCDLGELLLRAELCEPALNTDVLLLPGFADQWSRLDELGVAVLPTAGLHAHGERKGWRWTVDEITDATAARDEDIARIGTRPVPAVVLGHQVDGPLNDRPQTVLTGHVTRSADGVVRWDRGIPEGCVGAPVFILAPRTDADRTDAPRTDGPRTDADRTEGDPRPGQRTEGDPRPGHRAADDHRPGQRALDDHRPSGHPNGSARGGTPEVRRTETDSRLLCAGVILPGHYGNEVATFDRVRAAVRELCIPVPSRRRWPRRP